jgi:AcrR family transcriptional regulator
MSTGVDQRRPRTPAAETRARILASSRLAFCQAGFDQLGVRELAAAADVDPAVLIRLFGSKEALFAEVAAGAFELEAPFDGARDGLGLRVAKFLAGKLEPQRGFDGLAFLVRSAGSPTAAPILSAALQNGFVGPLATVLGGRDAGLRAAMMAACVLGFSTLRVALGSPILDAAPRARVIARLGAVLQACVEPSASTP